jgi:heptosyltransferase III
MRILLVKLKHIGDTLLLTPTIRWLRQEHPDAVIDVVIRSGCEPVLTGNRDISNILLVPRPETRQRSWSDTRTGLRTAFRIATGPRYDYAFDLSNSDRAKQLVALSRARVRGINDHSEKLGIKRRLFNAFSSFAWRQRHQVEKDFYTVTEIFGADAQPGPLVMHADSDHAAVAAALPGIGLESEYAVLHPTSRWAFKEWRVERWIELADWLQHGLGLDVIVSAGPDSRETAYANAITQGSNGAVSTQGRLSLPQLAALLKNARLFVGIDTAVMHLAAAMQTPSVVLFGPSKERQWSPWQCRHRLILGDCKCKREGKITCDKSHTLPCMGSLSVAHVTMQIGALLDDTRSNTKPHDNTASK